MGLTLLGKCGLAKKFWVESFLIVVYLIKLPMPVLNNDTLFSKLYKITPDYPFYAILDADAIFYYALMLKTNYHIAVFHVFLLVIAQVKRVIGA